MVVLDTKLSVIQELVGKKLTEAELDSALYDVGFSLEDVQGDAIKIDITPDRIDALSPRGLARILRSTLNLARKPQIYSAKPSKEYKVIVDPSVNEIRPYTVCAVVKNLLLDSDAIKQIIWIQEKLHATLGKHRRRAALGVYPLDKISWPVIFCAKKPAEISFQPLESVSFMTAKQILEHHPTGVAYSYLLSGLPMYPLFVDANKQVLSMPPIINSQNVGKVTTDTRNVFIEVSGFDEKILSNILNLLVCFLADMGGQICTVEVQYGKKKSITPNLEMEERKITTDAIKSLTGIELQSKEIANHLSRMLYTITKVENSAVKFLVPPYRLDIWHDVDVIDDIVRAFGINNIIPVEPSVQTTGSMLFENRFVQKINELLVGAGCVEIMTLAVTDKQDQFTKMQLVPKSFVALGSTAERNINMVRSTLLPESLKFLSNNASATFPQHIFEIGDIVVPDEEADVRSRNVTHCTFALCDEKANFTAAKQLLESVLAKLGANPNYTTLKHESFIEGRSATILVNGKSIGYFGEIHPQVLVNWKLETPIAGAEIDIDALICALQEQQN